MIVEYQASSRSNTALDIILSGRFKIKGDLVSSGASLMPPEPTSRQREQNKPFLWMIPKHCINTLGPRPNGRHFTDDISKCISWMKMFEFWLKIYWSLFLGVQTILLQHWFRLWLGAVIAKNHYLKKWWFIYRCIYVSIGLSELTGKLVQGCKNHIQQKLDSM